MLPNDVQVAIATSCKQCHLEDFILEFSRYINSSLHEDVPTILTSDTLKLEANDFVLFETLFCGDLLLCEEL